jgi:hypothetical protein
MTGDQRVSDAALQDTIERLYDRMVEGENVWLEYDAAVQEQISREDQAAIDAKEHAAAHPPKVVEVTK